MSLCSYLLPLTVFKYFEINQFTTLIIILPPIWVSIRKNVLKYSERLSMQLYQWMPYKVVGIWISQGVSIATASIVMDNSSYDLFLKWGAFLRWNPTVWSFPIFCKWISGPVCATHLPASCWRFMQIQLAIWKQLAILYNTLLSSRDCPSLHLSLQGMQCSKPELCMF